MSRKRASVVDLGDLVGKRTFGHVFKPRYRDRKTGKMVESAFWCVAYRWQGERHVVSSKSTNYEHADKLRWKIFTELYQGKLPWVETKEASLEEVLNLAHTHYAKNKRRSGKRVAQALAHVSHYFAKVCTPPIHAAAKVTTDRIDEYIVHRQAEGATNGTINRELAYTRLAFRLASRRLDENGVPMVPRVPYMQMLEEAPARQRYCTPAEYTALASALRQRDEDVADLLEAYYLLGWRRKEPLGLRWTQVNWFAKTLMLESHQTKNKTPLEIPFGTHPRLFSLLTRRRRATDAAERETGEPCPWVFHRGGKPIKTFRRVWISACREAGIPTEGERRLIVHDFVRTAARLLAEATDTKTAAEIMNKKTLSIFYRYRITDKGTREAALRKLAEVHERQEALAQLALPFAAEKKA